MCLNSQDQRSKNPITDVQSDVENDLSKNKNRITHLRVYRNNILDRIDICKKNVEFLPNDLNEIKKCAYCG